MAFAIFSGGLTGSLAQAAVIGIAMAGVSGAINPLLNVLNQGLNQLLPIQKPTPNELVDIYYRRNKQFPKFKEWMNTWGLNDEVQSEVIFGKQQLAQAADLIILFRRGQFDADKKKNEQAFFSRMEQVGITVKVSEDLLFATQQFENTQQVFTWLVREVLDADKRKALQLDDEFPPEALNFAKNIGIPEYVMRNDWAGHWVLATPEQLSEVMHRYSKEDRPLWEKEIKDLGLDPDKVQTNLSDVKDVLKFADIGPFYREKLTSIAFNNLGRIESRWQLRFRFVDFKEAVYLYKRLGLNQTLAERIAKMVFVTQSITDWKAGIRHGAMTWEDVQAELTEWHIDEPKVVSIVQLKVAPEMIEGIKDVRDFTLAMTRDFFLRNQIDREKALELLGDINFGDFQRKLIMEKWDIEKQSRESGESKKKRTISKTDIKQRFIRGLISESAALKELIIANYVQQDAEKILRLWNAIKDAKKK